MTATILVVDDIEANIKLLKAKLTPEYYSILTANSSEQAFVILKNNNVDLILLDIMMPGIDGITACKIIKQNPETSYIPIVIVTALEDIEDRIRGLDAGADEFLSKPLNDLSLFARIKSLTRMKTILDELKLRNQTKEDLGYISNDIINDFSKSKIVILDDDLIQAKNISRILTSLVQEITIFNKVEELDSFLQNYKPDIVMISCQIDNIDPLRVCVNLRAKEHLKYTSLVLIAEEDKNDMLIKGMEIGINDYFITPIDNNELIVRIKTQLKRKIYIDNLKNDLEQNFHFSIKDGLTNLFNRRYFDNHIKLMANNAQKSNKLLSLIMLDIDYFKLVNDKYGHQAGDIILQSIAEILRNHIRVIDLAARYGGEEFTIIISDLSTDKVLILAENLRKHIENINFNISTLSISIKITASMGIASYKDQSVEELIRQSDNALYSAKRRGRNQICLFSDNDRNA
jgi:two-component system cell cycle response regulator